MNHTNNTQHNIIEINQLLLAEWSEQKEKEKKRRREKHT